MTCSLLIVLILNVVAPFIPISSQVEAAVPGIYLTSKWTKSSTPTLWEGSGAVGELVAGSPGLEVLVAGGSIDQVQCLRGSDGALIWSYSDSQLEGYSQPLLYDVNLDGNLDAIVPLTYPAGLVVLNGNNGCGIMEVFVGWRSGSTHHIRKTCNW